MKISYGKICGGEYTKYYYTIPSIGVGKGTGTDIIIHFVWIKWYIQIVF